MFTLYTVRSLFAVNMASLAEIIHKENAEASRHDAVQREIKRQIAAAEVWDGAQELADLEMAMRLSKEQAGPESVPADDEGKSHVMSRMGFWPVHPENPKAHPKPF